MPSKRRRRVLGAGGAILENETAGNSEGSAGSRKRSDKFASGGHGVLRISKNLLTTWQLSVLNGPVVKVAREPFSPTGWKAIACAKEPKWVAT